MSNQLGSVEIGDGQSTLLPTHWHRSHVTGETTMITALPNGCFAVEVRTRDAHGCAIRRSVAVQETFVGAKLVADDVVRHHACRCPGWTPVFLPAHIPTI